MHISLSHRLRRLALTLAVTASVALGAAAQSSTPTTDLIVPIPTVPENITLLNERCNYIIDNFWSHANLKSAFSAMDKMDATFGQFLAFTPYADASVVHGALDRLIEGVTKADSKNLIKLARMAEKWTGSDTAEYASEELFFPFVKAVATSKKVKDPEKARFQALYRQLSNSMVGTTPADFAFTCPDGTTGHLSDVKGKSILLYFYDPDCTDCRLARARLGADYVLPALVSNGLVSILAIYPGEADADWEADVASMPDGWIIGAAPEIDLDFTINHQPEIYYLDENRQILAKGVTVDNAIEAFRSLVTLSPSKAEPAADKTGEKEEVTR